MTFTRRDALKAALATTVGAFTGIGAHGVAARRRLTRTDVQLQMSGLPPALDGLRIALLTDIHHSALVSANDVRAAVSMALDASPDMVVLGGDYVTFGDRAFVDPVAELLAPLNAPHGVFAILGNHDDDRDMPAALARKGFTVLKDQRTRLSIRHEDLELVGIRFWTRRVADIGRALAGARGTTLMLAHDPRRLVEAAGFGVPGVLSGHTHGGQVVLPGVGAIAKTRFPILAGLGRTEQTRIFVSRGIGTTYVPVRINCPPEVAVITLRRHSEI